MAVYFFLGVLNFASAIKAGGGWLNGKVAQEEDIMRKTNAFVSLLSQDEFYVNHSPLEPIYTDSIIYTRNASIIRDDDFNFIRPKPINLYTCAAVNVTEIKKKNPQYSSVNDMYNRIYRILNLMASNNEETLVLGAFGCGAFLNDPKVVAQAAKNVLADYLYAFKVIEYAIYCSPRDDKNFKIFKQVLQCLMD